MYIQIENLTKFYGEFRAVNQLSMEVDEGDIYGFLGPNGAGKSTTIRMILGLIRPTSGCIKLFGEPLSIKNKKPLSRVGALIEKPDFYNYLPAKKNLEILGRLSEIPNLNKRVDEVLDIVGLLSRKNSKVKTFSQGMKQRLGIAQTLLHKPDLIILDEPTNGLDPQGQKEIRDLILRLKEERNITVLISSHLLLEMELMATRMIIINKGKALVQGTVQELLQNSEQKLTIQVENPEHTIQVIKESPYGEYYSKNEGNKLVFKISKDKTPEMAAFLSAKDCRLNSIEPVRSLEDFFLHITEDEKVN